MSIRLAINGAGRIGRTFLRLVISNKEIDLVVINDLGDIDNIAYLIKHDSVYGTAPFDVSVSPDKTKLILGNKEVGFISEKDPNNLPWKALAVDVVVESTGVFTTYEKAKAHLDAGAKKVVVTAPMKDDPVGIAGATVLMGVNEKELAKCVITSDASCTTNAASPLIAILDEHLGIEKAVLNTVHAHTASQVIVDAPSRKDFREGRSGGHNIVPTSTGAAIAVTKAFPKLEGLFDGIAIRVPVIAGSIVDVTFISKKETNREEINQILKDASKEARWSKVFSVTEEPLVSTDIIGSPYGSIADLSLTRVIGKNLVKVLAWYDNEMGYCYTLLEHVLKAGNS